MISAPYELPHDDNNPLDMVEELAEAKGWKFTRDDNDFLILTMPGFKDSYEVTLEWQEEFSSVLFSCTMNIGITESHYEATMRTLEQVNRNMWMGHFDLSTEGKYPTYRQTLLFRMIPTGLAVDIINDVMEIALAECNRFYTTFQLVAAGDVRLQDNLHAAVFETVGEA